MRSDSDETENREEIVGRERSGESILFKLILNMLNEINYMQKNKLTAKNKIKTWMIVVLLIFGGVIGGIIAALVDAFFLQKHINSVWVRFGIMFIIAIVVISFVVFFVYPYFGIAP